MAGATAPSSAGEFDELTGTVVERADAVLGADDDVLDAGAAAPGQVDARLDRERHARHQRQVVPGHDVGRLVGVQPDAVAGAVDEVLPPARVGDDLPGGGVDLLGGHAGTHRRGGGP